MRVAAAPAAVAPWHSRRAGATMATVAVAVEDERRSSGVTAEQLVARRSHVGDLTAAGLRAWLLDEHLAVEVDGRPLPGWTSLAEPSHSAETPRLQVIHRVLGYGGPIALRLAARLLAVVSAVLLVGAAPARASMPLG